MIHWREDKAKSIPVCGISTAQDTFTDNQYDITCEECERIYYKTIRAPKLLVPVRASIIAQYTLFVRTSPLSRPRSRGKWNSTYQPIGNQKELRSALSLYDALSIDHAIIIDSYCCLKQARTGKLKFATGRNHGDEDNLRKAISDGLQAANIIADDKFIVGGENYKFFGNEDITHIIIWKPDDQFMELQYGI